MTPSKPSEVAAEKRAVPISKEAASAILFRAIAWWQPKLFLNDIQFISHDRPPKTGLLDVSMANGGENPHTALIGISDEVGQYATRTLWEYAVHELGHVLAWAMWYADWHFSPDFFSETQAVMICKLQKPGYENLAYKLQRIFTTMVEYPGDATFEG